MQHGVEAMKTENQTCEGGICKGSRLANCPPCLLIWGAFAAYLALSWLIP